MKLVVAVVHSRDRNRVADELVRLGLKFTIIGSTGGFLREGNATFMLGVEEAELESAKQVFQETCSSREQVVSVGPIDSGGAAFLTSPIRVPVGGAVMFVMNVEEYARY